MRIDERIASLDRMRRQNEREEAEKGGGQDGPAKGGLTLDEALAGIREGKLRIDGEPLLEFDTYTCPVQNIPFVIFKNFYEAKQEMEEGIIYLKRAREISQILSWPKAEIKPTTFEQWGNLLVNGMAANRMHVEILKKNRLSHVEYICYVVPSGKGPVYNLMFRFRDQSCQVVGNYNCMKADKDTYGILLEAMVAELDRWAGSREQEARDE